MTRIIQYEVVPNNLPDGSRYRDSLAMMDELERIPLEVLFLDPSRFDVRLRPFVERFNTLVTDAIISIASIKDKTESRYIAFNCNSILRIINLRLDNVNRVMILRQLSLDDSFAYPQINTAVTLVGRVTLINEQLEATLELDQEITDLQHELKLRKRSGNIPDIELSSAENSVILLQDLREFLDPTIFHDLKLSSLNKLNIGLIEIRNWKKLKSIFEFLAELFKYLVFDMQEPQIEDNALIESKIVLLQIWWNVLYTDAKSLDEFLGIKPSPTQSSSKEVAPQRFAYSWLDDYLKNAGRILTAMHEQFYKSGKSQLNPDFDACVQSYRTMMLCLTLTNYSSEHLAKALGVNDQNSLRMACKILDDYEEQIR